MPRPPKPPDPAERARVLAAATAIMARRGPAGTKLADVARRAGVAYGTLYRHFPDRNSLLLAAILGQTAVVEAEWLRAPEDPDPVRRIINFCLAPLRRVERAPRLRDAYSAVMQGAQGIEGLVDEVQRLAALGRRQLSRLIRDAKRSGYFGGLEEDVLSVVILGIPATYLSTVFVPERPNWARVEAEVGRIIRRLAGHPAGRAPRRPQPS